MAGDDDAKTGRLGIEVEFFKIVEHVYRDSVDFYYLLIGYGLGPFVLVVVTSDGCDRGDLGQLFQNLGFTDVAGMEDAFDPAECVNRRGS